MTRKLIEQMLAALQSKWTCSQTGDIDAASTAAREYLAQPEQSEPDMVLAPHYRGYARLGIGAYCINHSADDAEPELVISIATDEEKAERAVGEDMDNAEGTVIQLKDIAVRIAFENVAGLDALEKQLRRLRESHFAADTAPPLRELSDAELGQMWLDTMGTTEGPLPVIDFAKAVLAAARSKT